MMPEYVYASVLPFVLLFLGAMLLVKGTNESKTQKAKYLWGSLVSKRTKRTLGTLGGEVYETGHTAQVMAVAHILAGGMCLLIAMGIIGLYALSLR
jgi:hypothetical protein